MDISVERHAILADSLVEEGRIAKKPILPWILDLLGSFAMSGDGESADQLAVVQNNLGLILLQRGQAAAAHASCRRQILWARNLGRVDLAVQPLINLIRLERVTGNKAGAVQKLDLLERLAAGSEECVDDISLFIANREDREFAAAVTVIERFNLAMADDAAAVRVHFESPAYRIAATGGGSIFAEQLLRAGLGYKLPDVFESGLAALSGQASSYNSLVELYYRATWDRWFCSSPDRARKLAAGVKLLSDRVVSSALSLDHRFLRLTFSVARLAALDEAETVPSLLKNCVALANRLDDVHYRLLACYRLGWTERRIADAMSDAGYDALKGLPIKARPSAVSEIDGALATLSGLIEDHIRSRRSEIGAGPDAIAA